MAKLIKWLFVKNKSAELLESCFCTQLSSLQNTLKAQIELDKKLRIILNG